jgi:soluble lytic murein transglycosylase-like protein
MRQHLLLLMALTNLVPAAFAADGIIAVHENGRTIYVDSPSSPKKSESSAHRRRASVLVYWSRSEGRWKPVRPTPSAMRAARSAAAEVSEFLSAAPLRDQAAPAEPGISPDNREFLRGRAMSSRELDGIIEEAAHRHNVDTNLVRALIKVESNFNPRAVSNRGAMGLMQLMPATARSLNVSNPFDPQQNVDAGVRHLRGLLDNYQGDVVLSLAAYNAGSGAVARNHGVPPYAETRKYVRKITELYNGPPVNPRSAPVRMYRDPNGGLRITNTD